MRTGMAAFSGGVILLYCVGERPPWMWLVVLVLAAVAALLACRCRGRVAPRLLLVVVGLCFGAGWALIHAESSLDARLLDRDAGAYSVTGYRCSLVGPGTYDSRRFAFCVTQWHGSAIKTPPTKFRLAVYGDDEPEPLPHRMRVTVNLKPPHGSVNPAGFRYERWLFRNGFHATGTVRSIEASAVGSCGVSCRYHRWRDRMAVSLAEQFGSLTHFRLVETLVLGERRRLTDADWERFRATGTTHLIAISGLHIGLVGGLAMLLTRGLLWLMPMRVLGSRSRRGCLVMAALLAGLGYALMAGLSVPTQRALVMALVGGLAWLMVRRPGAWTAWLVALFLVLMLDPKAPLDPGFWLSFGAVASLILVFRGRLRRPRRFQVLMVAQAGIFCGLWPILSAFGDAPVLVGWLANLLAIPLVSVVILPVILMVVVTGLIWPAMTPLASWTVDPLLGGLIEWLSWLAAWPAPDLAWPLWLALPMALGGLMLIMMPVSSGYRCLVVISFSALVLWPAPEARKNQSVTVPELWIWDVGQGLSALFRSGDQAILYDTGPSSPSGYSAVESVILPSLDRLGVQRLDTVILSHGDGDHTGGLMALLEGIPVDRLLVGEPERLNPAERRAAGERLAPCGGARINVGKALFSGWQGKDVDPGNASSCVVTIRLNGNRVVLPGDIPASVERQWLEDHPHQDPARTLLVAAHHGSQTSSGERWVKRFAPAGVVFSAGYRHPYGHPADRVVERFVGQGSRLFSTALQGALRFEFHPGGIRMTSARYAQPFWVRPPQLLRSGKDRVWRGRVPVLK